MAKVKKKDYEKLSASNIEKVINLLEPDEPNKPITKKEACQLLNITYNTTRLQNIIDEHREKLAFIAKRKAQNRGKSATDLEIKQAVEEYLSGENYSTIAKRLFRSSGFVKALIQRVGVPSRPTGKGKRGITLLPDRCRAESFEVGEIVWSAKYHKAARIVREVESQGDYLGKVYSIYVLEPVNDPGPWFTHVMAGGYFAYQPAYDLGKLEHLKQYDIDFDRI